MHYYSFNIGDYASHTRHLTAIEDLAYRRLLDLYYLHEQPLNESSTTVARLINMRDYVQEVQAVLEEFFELVDGQGWINGRADEEIAKYHSKLESASRAGRASAERRANASSTTVQPNKKQEPITNNQEPEKKQPALAKPAGVSDQVWNDFLKQRKALKAPLTETALKAIIKEADKAGWTLEAALTESSTRGWRSFKAEWVAKDGRRQPAQTFNDKDYGESREI